MYSLQGFGKMVLDRGRTSSYASALRQHIRPDSVVLDIGCGPGILSLIACQFGARKVYAIEPADVIGCARDAATKNGFADRIVFFQDLSTAITLPEKADVIVADIRGVLPFFSGSITSLMDARERLLAPGGVLIPQRDSVWVCLVEAAERYGELVNPFLENEYALRFPDAALKVTNQWEKAYFKPEQLVTDPVCWATIDYTSVESPNARGTARWNIEHPRTAHGLGIWFDTELTPGHAYSNAPTSEKHIYGQAFFPFAQPLELRPGGWVNLDLRADLIGDSYIWSWTTAVGDAESSAPRHTLRQSTFLGTTMSKDSMRKRAATYVPALNPNGQLDSMILAEMGSGVSLEHIACKIAEKFPARFASARDALVHVADLSVRYSS